MHGKISGQGQIQGKNLAKIKGNFQIGTVGAYQLKYIQQIFIKCFQYDGIKIMQKNKTLQMSK